MAAGKLREALRALGDVFFPRYCLVCSRAIPHGNPIDICPGCRETIALPQGRYCPRCSRPVADYGVSCPNCHNLSLAMDASTAFGLYNGVLRKRLIEFKFSSHAHLARTFGALVALAARRAWPQARFDAVTAVPLHSSRSRERGFDQSRAIARYVSRGLGVPFRPRLLARTRPTDSQVGLTKTARVNNVKGAFAASRTDGVVTALVIDDIMTTGATASEAARALKRAGVKHVYVAVVARPDGAGSFDADGERAKEI